MAETKKASSLPIIVVSILWYTTLVTLIVSLSNVRGSDELTNYKAYIGALLLVFTLVFLLAYGTWKKNSAN